MKKKTAFLLGGALIVMAGATAFAMLSSRPHGTTANSDPRQEPPVVRLTTAVPTAAAQRSFTGIVAARVQSNIGFRVPGKIVERLVNVGQVVKVGQPLMRIDETDLRLALTARRNAVAAVRAGMIQADADEQRYARLVRDGWSSKQRYEQAKAASDAARAQVASAEAAERVAANEVGYSLLLADSDGTVVETLGEPGQVVAAGQPVVRLAQAGPREAVIALPETIRPTIGSMAETRVYGSDGQRFMARLRQLSDSADPQTRTYEARYVLEGEAATAPLGATVTIRIGNGANPSEIAVPLGAVLDDGGRTGVWALNKAASTVHFRAVNLVRMTGEAAVVSGLNPGDEVVALGAHLLREGVQVKAAAENKGAQ